MLKLSSTSALVLLWAEQECYKGESARYYLSQLDLEEGKALYKQCEEVWPYYDEVIKNRKFGVFSLIEKCCTEKISCQQVVIAGAGLDALGIEITERYPRVKVFEIDKENMSLKSHLFKNSGNKSKASIMFIEIDILNIPSLYGSLTAHGWDTNKPTALILEGISYYLPPESIQELVQVINPDWVIFEFLKEDHEITADRVKIPQKIFGFILNQCELPDIWRYSCFTAGKLFDMPVAVRYSMKQLEKMRTGSNRFFQTEDSGWIEVCLLVNQ